MARIDIEKRQKIINLHNEGFSQRQISNEVNIGRPAIQKIINKKIKYNYIEDMPKSGRKRIYSDRELGSLIRLSTTNPFSTARELRNKWKSVSISTVKLLQKRSFWKDFD